METLNQRALKVSPLWWRHGAIKLIAYEFEDGSLIPGFELDYTLDEARNEPDFDSVYQLLVDQEKTYLSKWPFLYELDKDAEYRGKLDTLPTEFIAHQVRDIDTECLDDLTAFVRDWGFPYSPLREDPLCAWGYPELAQDNMAGINETENLRRVSSIYKCVISISEVAATLELLKEVWRRAEQIIIYGIPHDVGIVDDDDEIDYWSDEEWLDEDYSDDEDDDILILDIAPINAASCSPMVAYDSETADDMRKTNAWTSITNRLLTSDSINSTSLAYRGRLTSAIANQLLETISDPTEWKRCKCDDCGRIFKRKQGASLHPDNKSQFCSETCRERAKKRRHRATHAVLTNEAQDMNCIEESR